MKNIYYQKHTVHESLPLTSDKILKNFISKFLWILINSKDLNPDTEPDAVQDPELKNLHIRIRIQEAD